MLRDRIRSHSSEFFSLKFEETYILTPTAWFPYDRYDLCDRWGSWEKMVSDRSDHSDHMEATFQRSLSLRSRRSLESGFHMITMISAIAELFFLSDRSDRSDHMETRLISFSVRILNRLILVWSGWVSLICQNYFKNIGLAGHLVFWKSWAFIIFQANFLLCLKRESHKQHYDLPARNVWVIFINNWIYCPPKLLELAFDSWRGCYAKLMLCFYCRSSFVEIARFLCEQKSICLTP